ncbi:LIM/homeobox protein Lhx9-like [Mobula birostris]|uniref:LIM/homeobox protein Lhx9-like n=1 Tax=Mobula birostris TaxID=1983395 RepID=UPI003B28A1E2
MEGGCSFQYSSMLIHGFPEEEIRETLLEEGITPDQPSLHLDIQQAEPSPQGNVTQPAIAADRAAVCAGCGEAIYDRYVVFAVDKPWHSRCLRCCVCGLVLGSELTCFSKDAAIYCKDDYYRRFCVKQCSRCQLGILASEMVMRAKEEVYHLSCFTCAVCGRALVTGDLFGTRHGLVYCQEHFEPPGRAGNEARLMDSLAELALQGDEGLDAGPGNTEWPSKLNGSSRKRRLQSEGDEFHSACTEGEQTVGEPRYPGQQKAKRIRTCFKHHQLRTMESYFAVKHNPDGKDWEQLSKKTGLPKRVLQVWFQNARAKLRKSLLQEENTDSDTVPEIQEAARSPGTQPALGPLGPPSPLFSIQGSPLPPNPQPTMAPIFLNVDPSKSDEPLRTIDHSSLC